MVNDSPGLQYEDICRIAGPLKPQWVKRIFSLKDILSLKTRQYTEFPASEAYQSASFPVIVRGTSAGAVSIMDIPRFRAVRNAKSEAPNLATGNPPLAITIFGVDRTSSSPALFTKTL